MDFYKKIKFNNVKEWGKILNSISRFLIVVLIFIHVFHLKKDNNVLPLLQKIVMNTSSDKYVLNDEGIFLLAN